MNKHLNTTSKSLFQFIFPCLLIICVTWYMAIAVEQPAAWSFDWTPIRPVVKDSLFEIERHGQLECRIVGYAGRKSKQWSRTRAVLRIISLEELQALKEHPTGIIRALAYEGLMRRQKNQIPQLLSEAFQDTTVAVNYTCGCTGMPYLLGEHLVQHALGFPPLPLATINKFQSIAYWQLKQEDISQIYAQYHAQTDRRWEILAHLYQ